MRFCCSCPVVLAPAGRWGHGPWYTEKQTENMGLSLKVNAVLHWETTPYQELAVLDTVQYGRMLVLDGMVQTTGKDEYVYHEMITHVAMYTHPNPAGWRLSGGGDGGPSGRS